MKHNRIIALIFAFGFGIESSLSEYKILSIIQTIISIAFWIMFIYFTSKIQLKKTKKANQRNN